MSKPSFDPSQPFETGKPAFDPNKPFEASGTDSGQPQGPSWEEMGALSKAEAMVRMVPAAFQMTPQGKLANYVADNPTETFPLVGAAVLSPLGPGGMAAGAGLGQVAKRMVDIKTGRQAAPAMDDPNATLFPSSPMTMFKESLAPMAQTAMQGLPEVEGVKKGVQAAAQGLARRGLGIKGALLKRIGIDKAEEVGQTMLDKGVIKPFSSTRMTLKRAEGLAETEGEKLGQGLMALDDAGVPSIEPQKLADHVYQNIRPKYSGGAYDAQEKVAQEVRDTILAHAQDGKPITFESAQALKKTLKDMGEFNHLTDKNKAIMYRKASSTIRQAIEDTVGDAAGKTVVSPGGPSLMGTDMLPQGEKVVGEVGQIPTDVLERYNESKKIYGHAETAVEGLSGKVTSEASREPLSVKGTIIAAMALKSGNITPALEALGAYEVGTRYGARAGAATINLLNNNAIAENVRRAIVSEFITRISTKENSR